MHNKKRNGAVLLFILLFSFWMIIASDFHFMEIFTGLLASLMIVLYNFDMVFHKDEATSLRPKSFWAFFILFFILLKEIVVANFHVAKIVLSPKMNIEPGFKKIRQPLKKDFNRALFGNAITLTPGTLTVDMNDEEIIVHGLEIGHIEDLEGSALQKAFIHLEEANHD
ncbi:Na+/H+ antiporter subunit E [Peloplasma aerotolerans]|jgi:multicomponent Na+:H+ antiporter subunit E|uniref:Na+/H+ antiporter subunit E n=1 Tax=Peloplasma aerotolerans TaxID=3044389 RepID=A0AAW6U5Z2_9MOLU|nr:Na+/H+ antiporter subunit E [Mariniplasma sp. M4Ah]MDI6453270.1 Na+/H+ antiporter subunit E [Mariniplasma sp. M4Ah]MDR4968824.1 Na+/H+ antiporter subunit E [Acholeplasmataceae bacterium]